MSARTVPPFTVGLSRVQKRTLPPTPCIAEPLPESLPAPEAEPSPVMDALLALPEKPRVAMELHYIEGYDVRECARMLGVPEGTVKWRLSRGRALLRDALGEEALS